MTFDDFIRLAQDYSNLGQTVTDQLRDVIVDPSTMGEQNRNALRYCLPLLRELQTELADGEEAKRVADAIEAHLTVRA